MLKFSDIKIFFESRKKFLERRDEVEKLIQANELRMEENEDLKDRIIRMATPEVVLYRTMKRGIAWYDYNELNPNQKREYYNNIQAVITNESFINELNHLIADQVESIARESKNFDEVMNIRMTINAVDMIKERLESIPDPRVPEPTAEEIHEAI